LRGPASEVFHVKGGHRFIVAHVPDLCAATSAHRL
jgi:hypothetical protein